MSFKGSASTRSFNRAQLDRKRRIQLPVFSSSWLVASHQSPYRFWMANPAADTVVRSLAYSVEDLGRTFPNVNAHPWLPADNCG